MTTSGRWREKEVVREITRECVEMEREKEVVRENTRECVER